MKPIELTLENFRSFRDSRTISFNASHLRAIVGDTGAGKSSMLHALTYALYNTTQHRSLNLSELLAKGATSASVTLVFEVDGQRWTIRRGLRRQGTFLSSLRCEDGAETFDGVAPVKKKIQELLEMDEDVFMKTVCLPQGQYQALLTAGDADRQDVLRKILDLQILPNMAVISAVRYREADQAQKVASEQLESFAGLEQKLGETRANQQERRAAVGRLQQSLDTARTLSGKRDALGIQLRELDVEYQRLSPISQLVRDLEALHGQRAGILAEIERLTAERTKHDEAVQSFEKALTELAENGLDTPSLAHVRTTLQKIDSELTELARSKALLSEAEKARYALTDQALRARSTRRNDHASERASSEAADEAATTLEALSVSVQEYMQLKERFDAAQAALARATIAVETSTSDVKKAEDSACEKSKVLKTAQEQHTIAEEARQAAEHTNHAAALARSLKAGDSCPVCTGTLPPTYISPTSVDLDKATRALSNARTALDQATAAERTATEIVASKKAALESAENIRSGHHAALTEVQATLAQRSLDEAALATHLGKMLEQEGRLRQQLPDLRKASNLARSQFQRSHGAAITSLNKLASNRRERGTLEAAIQDRELRVADLSADLPRRFSLGQLDLPTCRARAAEIQILDREANAVGTTRDAAVTARTECQKKLDSAQQEESTTAAPWTRQLDYIAQLANSIDGSQMINSLEEAKAAEELINAKLATVAAQTKGLQTEHAHLTTELDALLKPEKASHLDDLQERLTEAKVSEAQTASLLQQLQERQEQATAAKRRVEGLVPIVAASNALRQLLHKDGFQQFVFQQRQSNLVHVGSDILLSMTGNRYAFTRDFKIEDRPYGETRPAVSLSGGEQFIASLALALAVVELAAAGGAKIDALFLDEGFDTLDRESLEQVMTVVRERALRGRAITIITHLATVAKFVDETLIVKKTPSGSTVTAAEDVDELDPSMERMLSSLT